MTVRQSHRQRHTAVPCIPFLSSPLPCLHLSVLPFHFMYLSPSLKSRTALFSIHLEGLGERCTLYEPSGVWGRAPAEIGFWCILGLKIWHLVAIIFNDFPENKLPKYCTSRSICRLSISVSDWSQSPIENDWLIRLWCTIFTCAKKLTNSQLNLLHGTKRKKSNVMKT